MKLIKIWFLLLCVVVIASCSGKSGSETPKPNAAPVQTEAKHRESRPLSMRQHPIQESNNELCNAIARNDLREVESLLKKGANPFGSCLTDDIILPIIEFSYMHSNNKTMEFLLRYIKKNDPDMKHSTSVRGAMGWAVRVANFGDYKPLEILINNGVTVENEICKYAKKEVILFLVKIKADQYLPQCKWGDFYGRDPYIKIKMDKSFVEYLLSRGMKPSFQEVTDLETAKLMLSKGADVNENLFIGGTIAHNVNKRNLDLVKFFVDNGANENTKRSGLDMALCLMRYDAEHGGNRTEMAQYLMSNMSADDVEKVLQHILKHYPSSESNQPVAFARGYLAKLSADSGLKNETKTK